MSSESPGDPRLLERLEEGVSRGAALRQLSRRYSLLHADYERLLGRLEELEGQISAPAPAGERDTRLTDGIATPLLEMGSQYADAAAGMLRIVEVLQTLAGGGDARSTAPSGEPGGEAEHARWRGFEVEVTTPTFDELVDFQERLIATAGVQRVSIRAIEDNVATLLVELREPAE